MVSISILLWRNNNKLCNNSPFTLMPLVPICYVTLLCCLRYPLTTQHPRQKLHSFRVTFCVAEVGGLQYQMIRLSALV